jgi:outer membrane protein
MQKTFRLFLLLFLSLNKINAQKRITIEEVTKIVLEKSNKAKIIDNNFTKAIIESSFYSLSLLPKVSANISLPYQRSISEIIQSDGSQRFIERNYLNNSLNLTISQAVPFTGGSLSLSSSLNGSRDFNNSITSFSSNWVTLSYQQAVNGFNSFKWNKKLNSLNTEKDSINYLKEKIKLKYEVSKLFLDTQLIQSRVDLIKANIQKTEKIVFELEEKLKFGRVIKLEVEQAKITLEQLNKQLEISNLDYSSKIQSLKKWLNDTSEDIYVLEAIDAVDFIVDKKVLKEAVKKNGFDLDKTIELIEIEANIDKVKKEGAISVNLQFGLGINSSANDFSNLYDVPAQSQYVTIGTKIPILDWGKAKKNYALAKLEKENLQLELEEKEEEIEEQIEELSNYHLSLISQTKSLKEQLRLSKSINEMFDELLKLGRKTTAEYKAQLVETFNISGEYQKAINNLYLLKLKINEMNLIF